jgi:N-acetylmuramoyl-L-alanine amidase
MSSIVPNIRNSSWESKRARPVLGGLFLVLALPWFAGCESGIRVKDTSRTFRTVVIDAGHGGHDTGARARAGGLEKNAALDTALRLDPKLRAAGFNTVLTRRGDYFIPLGQRTRISNQQDNAIFVSLHYNHADNRRAQGVETFYRSKPSRKIAAEIQDAICRLPGVTSRGVKTANFWVLRRNEYPAVLVEGGFFSNPTEARRCASPVYREAVASAIATAIITQRGAFEPIVPISAPAAESTSTTGTPPAPATR